MSALDGLDDDQRRAAEAVRGPVRVLAGAGTGKTRVITHRIAHGVDVGAFSPQRVMAVTFTTRAAGEMRGRLRALGVEGVQARTFHAAALSQLNYFWPIVTGGERAPAVVPNKVRLLADAAQTIGQTLDTATLRDVAAEIEWRKVSMLDLRGYLRAGRGPIGRLEPGAVIDLHDAYEKLKDERRQLDFEDILLTCAGMIAAEPRVSRAVREQYRHFTVDEFQDVSPLQHHLLGLWVGERADLCVVGDASQTIYSFAGAEARFLLDFEREHPEATLVRLEHNYRSTPGVLAAANRLMRGRPGALELVAAAPAATGPGATPSAEEPAAETPPRARSTFAAAAFRDEEDEAAGIAAASATLIAEGVEPDRIAVLYRAHSQSAAIQQAFAARGIPAHVLGGKRFFDQPEIAQAMLMLRGESVARTSGTSDARGQGAGDLVRSVRDILRGLGMTDEPPASGGAVRESWEARAALLRLAENQPAGTSLRAFTDELQARARDQHEPTLRSVTLATLHAAKGLEWDHVHLAGLTEGQLPIAYARSFDAIDEERRLLYVGITRARIAARGSWAGSSGRAPRAPSRFLAELGIRTPDAARIAGSARTGPPPGR